MRDLFVLHGGDYGLVIQGYIQAERDGIVGRKNRGRPPEQYADALWRDGIGKGWLDASATEWRTGLRPSSTLPTPKQAIRQPGFDEALRLLGEFWEGSAERPRPSDESLLHWATLIQEWTEDPSMPLLIRKGALRNISFEHVSGRGLVQCDNSPAHWAFMGAFLGERPTLSDVREQLAAGHLPIALAPSREEKAFLKDEESESVGGYLGRSRYGRVNRFANGFSYKLCHIQSIGIRIRGDAKDLPLAMLQAHMLQFLNPQNMVIVPLAYAGVGECEAFLAAFRQDGTSE